MHPSVKHGKTTPGFVLIASMQLLDLYPCVHTKDRKSSQEFE